MDKQLQGDTTHALLTH